MDLCEVWKVKSSYWYYIDIALKPDLIILTEVFNIDFLTQSRWRTRLEEAFNLYGLRKVVGEPPNKTASSSRLVDIIGINGSKRVGIFLILPTIC